MGEPMTGTTKFTYVDDAASMAEFEEGRVKPISVLKATGANVVVSFDSGAELREHTALQPVLLQAIERTVTVRIAGREFALGPGDLLHIEPTVAQAHSLREGQTATHRVDNRQPWPLEDAACRLVRSDLSFNANERYSALASCDESRLLRPVGQA